MQSRIPDGAGGPAVGTATRSYSVRGARGLTKRSIAQLLEAMPDISANEYSGKVYFGGTRAPFTSRLSPEKAAEKLRAMEIIEITCGSRRASRSC
ncbi:hypothetical protein [Burkholderia stagnalis]